MRKDWNNYYMAMACTASERGTCDRAKVGAVIVDEEKRLVATGYNGSAGSKMPHCDDVGHVLRDKHCIATVHAEQNAIADCARSGKATKNASIYVTHFPCLSCTKLIISAGIKKIYFDLPYKVDPFAYKLIKENEIELYQCDVEDKCEIY